MAAYRVIVADSFEEEMTAQCFDDMVNKMIDTLGVFPKSHKHWIYEDDNGV